MNLTGHKFNRRSLGSVLQEAGSSKILLRVPVYTKVDEPGDPNSDLGKPMKFVISSEIVDRAGDTLAVDGWKLDEYLKNPIVMWMHNPYDAPIGKSLKVYVEGGYLKAEAVFASDIVPMAKTVEQLYRAEFLKCTSVGFVSDDYSPNETGGLDFHEQSLREWSAVTIPANPEAMREAKSAGIDVEPLREWAAKTLERIDGSGLWVSKADAENVIRALGGTKTFSIPAPSASTENDMADAQTQTVKMVIEVDASKAEAVIADLTKKAKNLGALLKSETADAANDDLASHIKALGAMCKDYKAALDAHGKANDDLGGHVKAFGDHLKALKDADGDDDGDKSATDTITKGAHKLSASQMKRVKSIAKAASEIQAAHHASQGASNGEPDDSPGDNDADADKAAADVKRKAQEAEIAALLKEQKELRMRLTGKVS